jgi:hypothetical protein
MDRKKKKKERAANRAAMETRKWIGIHSTVPQICVSFLRRRQWRAVRSGVQKMG